MTTTEPRSTALAVQDPASIIEQVIIKGDLAKLDPEQRVAYYRAVCQSVGLNELTRPFEYIVLNGKLTLYARKDAADQLREIKDVSIMTVQKEQIGDLYVVTVYGRRGDREDSEIGAVNIAGLRGEALANAMMKAVTKAKRRLTLSICGLGMLDETEIQSIPDVQSVTVDHETGEIINPLITSGDDPLWQNWLKTLSRARELGLNPEPLRLPVAADEIHRRGSELATEIRARRRQLKTEDEERTRAAGEAEARERAAGVDVQQTAPGATDDSEPPF